MRWLPALSDDLHQEVVGEILFIVAHSSTVLVCLPHIPALHAVPTVLHEWLIAGLVQGHPPGSSGWVVPAMQLCSVHDKDSAEISPQYVT